MWPLLDGVHDRAGLSAERALLSGIGSAADLAFEVAVKVFVRIEFRAVARKEEDLDGVRVRPEPLLDDLAVMDLQVVDNEEHLAIRIAGQTPKELDHDLGVDRSLEQREAQLAAIGYRAEHAQPFPRSLPADDWSFPLGRVPASCHVVTANACLVAPVDFRPFLPGTPGNGGVVLGKPTLDRGVVAFVSPLDRPLRGETPTLQVIADRADRQIDTETFRDQHPDRFAGPQRKRELQLIRHFVPDKALDQRSLPTSKPSPTAFGATSFSHRKRRFSEFLPVLDPIPDDIAMGANDRRDRLACMSRLEQRHCLPSPVREFRRPDRSSIPDTTHARTYNTSTQMQYYYSPDQ